MSDDIDIEVEPDDVSIPEPNLRIEGVWMPTDEYRAFRARLDRAEARAAEWKAMAERLAEQMRETVEYFCGEDGFTYNPDETEALAAFDALVARDADEEGGT